MYWPSIYAIVYLTQFWSTCGLVHFTSKGHNYSVINFYQTFQRGFSFIFWHFHYIIYSIMRTCFAIWTLSFVIFPLETTTGGHFKMIFSSNPISLFHIWNKSWKRTTDIHMITSQSLYLMMAWKVITHAFRIDEVSDKTLWPSWSFPNLVSFLFLFYPWKKLLTYLTRIKWEWMNISWTTFLK